MDGLLLVYKSEGPTSHDIIARLRRILGLRKVGHFGSLDPFASGLLLAGVGKAVRLFPFFSASDKTYVGRIRLGAATDTYDRTGTLRPGTETAPWPGAEAVRSAMDRLTGRILQTVPPYSAKKHRGRPYYAYARRREEVERKTCRVEIRRFSLRAYDPPDLHFEVDCSAGTYVRSLAHDLGEALGGGAYLAELVRTTVGPFLLTQAHSPAALARLARDGRAAEAVIPVEHLLPELPRVDLTPEALERVADGRPVPAEAAGKEAGAPVRTAPPQASAVRLFGPDGRLAALARLRPDGQTLAPFIVLV
ncbi:MAG: tRNA pseudouridine(55) synthase TruB [Candidatus Aminicenantes bacterium]|nr:tRNA pseudouridine(55) synthase TruB [Candidatus Aminicenantes bacterium]